MVFFSCDGCGEMLKKSHVDAHASRCRRCDSVSCVDCSVSFFGDDYRAHTSCITEAERYEGKLAKKPQKRNPQQEWMDIVATSVDNAPGHLKSYMQTMSGLDNIPRKEKQFRNFTANSLNLRGKNEAIVGEIWILLKTEHERRQATKQQQQPKESNKNTEVKKDDDSRGEAEENSQDKSNARDQSSEKSGNAPNSESEIDPKAFQKEMKKALKQAPNQSMKLKELRKLLGEKLGLPKSSKKILKKLLKDAPEKSKKSKIKVDGKVITLV